MDITNIPFSWASYCPATQDQAGGLFGKLYLFFCINIIFQRICLTGHDACENSLSVRFIYIYQ